MRLLIFTLLLAVALVPGVWGWAELGFTYRQNITISAPAGVDLAYTTLNVTIDTESLIKTGKMRSDCADVRFYAPDDTTKLSYYLESGCNTPSTLFWVKILGNYSNIYMYYDNPTATTESDMSSAFIFADNFNTLDTATWYEDYDSTLTRTVSGGVITIDANADGDRYELITRNAYSCPGNCTFEVKVGSTTGASNIGIFSLILEKNYTQATALSTITSSGYESRVLPASSARRLYVVDNGAYTELGRNDAAQDVTNRVLWVSNGAGNVTGGARSSTAIDYTITAYNTNYSWDYYLSIFVQDYAGDASYFTADIDWARLRKFVDGLTIAFGTEEHRAVNILIKDEDTGNVVNENITLSAYRLPTYDFYGSVILVNGQGEVALDEPYNYYLVAWSNQSYTNQRRLIVETGTTPPPDPLVIYLLQDGRGSINYFYVRSGGVSVQDAKIIITWSNLTIDSGFTDNNGLFISYLDPYKLYKTNATAEGYNSTEVTFYGSSLTTHEIILEIQRLLGINNIGVRFLPEEGKVESGEPEFLWIEVTNWQLVDNITVLVADDPRWVDIYERFNITEPGHSELYNFDLNDTDTSWCNATILCMGNNLTVRWRVMPTPINNFGSTGHVVAVAYVRDVNGVVSKFGRTGWIVRAYNAITDFFQRFSYEQRLFIGLLLVMMATGIASAQLNLSLYQSGFVAVIMILTVTALKLWTPGIALLPILAFIAVVLYKEVLK